MSASRPYAPVIATAANVIKARRVGGLTPFPLTTWMDGDVGADEVRRASAAQRARGRVT